VRESLGTGAQVIVAGDMGDRDELRGRSLGEFILRERIGQGGFADVYRCEQPLLGRAAVVKVLHGRLRASDGIVQRFLREAQLASRLDHPYAAHVYAFGVESDGLPWIAMELVRGTPLDRWLAEHGPLPREQLVPFIERIAEVVQTAHERGIVHRDLKPANVMVVERAGRLLPKLLDLGIAKLVADLPALVPVPPRSPRSSPEATAASRGATLTGELVGVRSIAVDARLTSTGGVLGSPPYMAPEQWSGAAVDPAADLYAFGVLVYEALTGRRPFVAESIEELAALHAGAPVPPVGPALPAAFDALFARALAKQPGDRYGTALELSAAVRVAAGLAAEPVELPRLEREVHEAWLAGAPQPLADAVALLEGARNLHQARDSALELYRGLVRYLVALALASHAHVRDDHPDRAVLSLLRELRRRDLDDGERLRLLRGLAAPFDDRRGLHPIPALVELARSELLGAAAASAAACAVGGTTDEVLRARLVRFVGDVACVLRAATFLLEYAVAIVRDGVAERWTGLRRPRRAVIAVTPPPEPDVAVLVDREGRVALELAPLVQLVAPTPGADVALFVFDGPGRRGARLVAVPSGHVHHDAGLWDWLADGAIGGAGGATPVFSVERAPYLALAPFATADADRFFGREREVEALVNRTSGSALQLVVGPSGAGKSSFVFAGVIPALPPPTRVIAMRPGARPSATAAALLAGADDAAGLVVVVDQLEELFTLCRDDGERERFAALLAELASGRARVIATVRDDFLMRVEALAAFERRLSSAVFLLGNPSREDLVRAIIEPARRAGYELSDPELAGEIADAITGHPGALALLSFTAARWWDVRDRRFQQLTRRAYEAMGGVGGALGRHAEAMFLGLPADDRRLARLAFRRLVTAEGTRARLSIAELEQALASPRAGSVVEALVEARLVVVFDGEDGPQIELAHEALLAAWPRAQDWLREDADSARLRDQLRSAARQWDDRGHAPGVLWRDEAVADLERWIRRGEGTALTRTEQAFVNASRALASRSRRIRRAAAGGAFAVLACALAVSLYFSATATTERRRADARARDATELLVGQLIEQGRRAVLDGKPGRALVALVEALDRGAERTVAIEVMVNQAVRDLERARLVLRGHTGAVTSLELLGDGRVLSASEDRTARIWDHTSGLELARFDADRELGFARADASRRSIVTAAKDGTTRVLVRDRETQRIPGAPVSGYCYPAISPDGQHLVTIHRIEREVRLWTIGSTQPDAVVALGDGTGPARGKRATWSPRGDTFAVSAPVQLHDAPTGALRARLPGTDSISALRFSPDGAVLATASFDGTARLWDAATGKERALLSGHGAAIEAIAFDPTGQFLVTGGRDQAARAWSVSDGQLRWTFDRLDAAVSAFAFLPDGRFAIGLDDGAIQLWTLHGGRRLGRLDGHAGAVADLVVDGETLISAGADGTLRTWRFERPEVRVLAPVCAQPAALALAPDATRIAVGCVDGTTAIIPLDGTGPRVLAPATGEVASIELISADQVVRGVRAGAVTVLEPDREPRTLVPSATAIALSADRRLLLTASASREVVAWDTATWAHRASWAEAAEPIGLHLDAAADRAVIVDQGGVRLRRIGAAGSSSTVFGHPASAAVATAGGVVASAGPDLAVWRAGRPASRAHGHTLPIFALRTDAAGERVVTSGYDAALRVWSARDGAQLAVLAGQEGHRGRVVDGRFGPRGLVYSVGIDETLRVWDPALQQPIVVHRAHRGVAYQLRVSSDGSVAVATDSDGGIVVHRVDSTPHPLSELRARARCLSLGLESGRIVPRAPPAGCP
jgi:WD40 repeat protein/serine/threonine protein kinase